MTANQFLIECLAVTVSPAIALENDKIKAALKQKDDSEVKRLLETEF